MKIEDVKIEDAADANYVIRKYFNNQLKNIKMDQLEQLILTVYTMGKNTGASAGSESSVEESPVSPSNSNPFKISDKAKTVEDVEIGQSGKVISANTAGTVSSVDGDSVSFMFESGEYGAMIEASLPFQKLEKIT
jgi:transcription antitermination factor NusG